jgi:hypothetical protein
VHTGDLDLSVVTPAILFKGIKHTPAEILQLVSRGWHMNFHLPPTILKWAGEGGQWDYSLLRPVTCHFTLPPLSCGTTRVPRLLRVLSLLAIRQGPPCIALSPVNIPTALLKASDHTVW